MWIDLRYFGRFHEFVFVEKALYFLYAKAACKDAKQTKIVAVIKAFPNLITHSILPSYPKIYVYYTPLKYDCQYDFHKTYRFSHIKKVLPRRDRTFFSLITQRRYLRRRLAAMLQNQPR